jgi:hypothetical protein
MTTLRVFVEADQDTKMPTGPFQRQVMDILTDARAWPRAGIRFVASSQKTADLWIRLGTNDTLKAEGFDMMSCAWIPSTGQAKTVGRSIINRERWLYGSDRSGLTVQDYRRYVINHETGHLLGLRDNMSCGAGVTVAPVMVQHTLGTRGYRANNRPRADEIDAVVRLGVGRLVVCRAKP